MKSNTGNGSKNFWNRLRMPGVTVSVKSENKEEKPAAVFRVRGVIDLGQGRKTAILDNLSFPEFEGQKISRKIGKNDLAIPSKIANLDCVFTSKGLTAVSNVYDAIRHIHAKAKFGPVVPDVLAPGDLLVFRHCHRKSEITFDKALRIVAD